MAQTIGSIDLASLKNLRDDLTQYFWFESNASATYGAGAHVTLVPDTSFISNPTGQNILMNTDGFSIRNGLLPMMTLDNDSLDFNVVDTSAGTYVTTATFAATGAQIGQSGAAHSVIDANGQRFYATDGTTQLANIGYGEGVDTGGGISDAPYYSLGLRRTASIQYNPLRTYYVGDVCLYDGKTYVCTTNIDTPEAWNQSHWRYSIGNYSIAKGYNTIAAGYASTAEGSDTTASGTYSHAEGVRTIASAPYSHAEGYHTTASGSNSHAEGSHTTAGAGSHAEGISTTASGAYSHAEGGSDTTASGSYSHAEGLGTQASGSSSHSQNRMTIAAKSSQTALGTYNEEDTSSTTTHPSGTTSYGQYAVIIGNGTADDARSNALTVDWDGNVEAAGGVIINKTDTAQKDLTYVNEYVCLSANKTASESAGQLTLSKSNKSCLVANKYDEVWSDYMNKCVSVENGVVTILKSGRYRFDYQVYFYNGFTANDIPICGIGLNGLNGALLRASRFKATVTNPFTTLSGSYTGWGEKGNTFYLIAQNSTAARGVVGLSQYTRLMVTCLMTH